MANTPGFFENMGNSIFGGGDSALTSLQKNGYAQYNPTAAPGTSQFFQGYQAQNANTGANQPYIQAQSQLLGQLGSEASGTGGPTVADQQLRAGVGATLSAQRAAVAGARGQNAGLAAHAVAGQAAGAESNYAGQAAAQRAQEQQNAQGALGGLTQGAIGEGNQLAEADQSAQNSAASERAAMGEAYGSMQNQNWQYYNNMMNQQQAQQNAAVSGQTNQAVAENQAIMGNPLNQVGGLVNTASQLTGMGAMMPSADGAVVGMADGGLAGAPPPVSQYDLTGPGGGAGGGTGYNPTARMGGMAQPMADGFFSMGDIGLSPAQAVEKSGGQAIAQMSSPGMETGMADGGVAPISASAENGNFNIPTLPSVSISSPQYVQSLTKPTPNPGTPPTQGKSPTSGGPDADPDTSDTSGSNAGATDLAPGVGEAGAVPAMALPAADGAVSAPVTHGPQEAVIGENGPEAVVPIKPNGDVDQARARNPALRQLLASHPDLRHVQPNGRAPGAPTGTGDHATAAALAMAGAHLSDRVAQLESIIPQLAKRGARRAA